MGEQLGTPRYTEDALGRLPTGTNVNLLMIRIHSNPITRKQAILQRGLTEQEPLYQNEGSKAQGRVFEYFGGPGSSSSGFPVPGPVWKSHASIPAPPNYTLRDSKISSNRDHIRPQ